MRVLAVISTFLAALLLAASPALADTCNKPASCPTSPAQVPLPYYALTFDTAYSSTSAYGFNATDPDGCGHTGIAVTGVNGGISDGTGLSYIDLVSTTSAQRAATQLPSLGTSTVGGSLANNSRGFSFEVTVKFLKQTQWAKIFCFGNGAGIGDLILGYSGTNLELDFSEYTPSGQNNPRTAVNEANVVVIPNPTLQLGVWYHIVVVVQTVDTYNLTANYFSYVNNVLANGTAATQYSIFDSPRPLSYIGRSCYNSDQLMQMELDTFRIYNQALNAEQVNSIYAQQMGGCNITMTANPIINNTYPNTVSAATSTPTPIYSLNFTTNPTPAGITPGYAWEQYDNGDVACGLNSVHSGLAVLAGGPNAGDPFADPSWINLTATTGPAAIANNPGLPTLGGFAGATNPAVLAGTAGLSFEMTFKPALQETWAKFFDFGSIRTNGNCNNDIVFGWQSNSLQFMNFEVCDPNGNGLSMGQWGPFLAGYWYHVVISLQQLPNGLSNWYAYLNGQLLSVQSNVQYPLAASRPWSQLGKSNWNDETWSGWIDSFNIYNVALSPAQVTNLSAIALGPSGASSCAFIPSNTSVIPASALYYDLSFNTNPAVTNQAYNWLAFDPSDTPANQIAHRGLVNLSGCVGGSCNGTYINMSAATGPYSAGKVLGDVGGIGTGSINDNTVGWSFEFSFKPYAAQTWSKMMDLGDSNGGGAGQWEIFFGWHNTDPYYNLGVIFNDQQDYNNGAASLDDLTPATPTITPGTWYHAVVTISYDYLQSETKEGSITYDGGIDYAAYNVYLNGVLTGNSTSNLYLYKVIRQNSMLAKSNYGDSYWQGLIDTFRVYSIALNANQVKTLYTASTQPASGSSSSSGVSAGSSSSSGATGVVPPSGGNNTAVSSASAVSAPTAASSVSAGNSTVASSSSSVSAASRSSSSSASSSSSLPTAIVVATSSSSSSPRASSSSTSAPSVTSSPTSTQYVTSPTSAPYVTSPTSAPYVTSPTSAPVVASSSSGTVLPPVIVNGAAQSQNSIVALVIVAVTALVAMVL